MSTCKDCRHYDNEQHVCWQLAALAREGIVSEGVDVAESIRVTVYADSSCSYIEPMGPGEVMAHIMSNDREELRRPL